MAIFKRYGQTGTPTRAGLASITARAVSPGADGQSEETVQMAGQTFRRRETDAGKPILSPAGRQPFIRTKASGLSSADTSVIAGSPASAYKSMRSADPAAKVNMLDLGEGQFVAAQNPATRAVSTNAPATGLASVGAARTATGGMSATQFYAQPGTNKAMDYQKMVQDRSAAKLGGGSELLSVSPGGFKRYRSKTADEKIAESQARGLASAEAMRSRGLRDAAMINAGGNIESARIGAMGNILKGLAGAGGNTPQYERNAQGVWYDVNSGNLAPQAVADDLSYKDQVETWKGQATRLDPGMEKDRRGKPGATMFYGVNRETGTIELVNNDELVKPDKKRKYDPLPPDVRASLGKDFKAETKAAPGAGAGAAVTLKPSGGTNVDYTTQAQLEQAYRDKKVTRAQAEDIAKAKGW